MAKLSTGLGPWYFFAAGGGQYGAMTESNGSAAPQQYEEMPDWEKRFRAPRVSLPDWAEDAPDRSLFVSNATGTYELYAWDRATGEQRQVTDRPNGTTDGVLSPDGEWIWWFDDKDGDEFGVWRRQPFERRRGRARRRPGLDPSYPAGLALGRDGRTAVVGPLDGRGRHDDPCGPARRARRSRSTATASRRASATCRTTGR